MLKVYIAYCNIKIPKCSLDDVTNVVVVQTIPQAYLHLHPGPGHTNEDVESPAEQTGLHPVAERPQPPGHVSLQLKWCRGSVLGR